VVCPRCAPEIGEGHNANLRGTLKKFPAEFVPPTSKPNRRLCVSAYIYTSLKSQQTHPTACVDVINRYTNQEMLAYVQTITVSVASYHVSENTEYNIS